MKRPGRKWKHLLLLVVLLFRTVTAHAAEPFLKGKLLLTGSSTMAPLITHMEQRYRQSHPFVQITVHGISSARGISDTRNGLNSIGMVSRALRENENDLRTFPVGQDGVCFITSNDSNLKSLTRRQLADIFTGRVTNWKEVGGDDAPISVVLRDEGGASTKLVAEYLSVRISDLHGIVIPAENSVTMRVVGHNPHAVSYVSFAELNKHDKARYSVRLLPADGVMPSRATINNGTYPLARVLNLVVKGRPSRLAMDFIRFATSPRVADILVADGFMPLVGHRHPHAEGKRRMP